MDDTSANSHSDQTPVIQPLPCLGPNVIILGPNLNQVMPVVQAPQQLILQPLTLQQQPVLVTMPQPLLNVPLSEELPISQMDALAKASDGVDLDEIRDLVRAFKEKRVALGLTQTQVGQDLEASGTGSVPYSQSYICRIEKLDITPRQAQQLKPILEKWLELADQRYCFLSTGGSLVPVVYNKFVVGNAFASNSKKRQKRTIFATEVLDHLNQVFDEDPSPNSFRLNELAKQLGLEYKTVRIWFCNKRQAKKKNYD